MRGVVGDVQSVEDAGKQGGGGRTVAMGASGTRCASYWREEEDLPAPGGLGRPDGLPGDYSSRPQVGAGKSYCSVLYFCSVFLLFNLLPLFKNQNRFKNSTKYPLDIFMLLNGLIQMHIKCSRVFESIFYTYYEYNSKCN